MLLLCHVSCTIGQKGLQVGLRLGSSFRRNMFVCKIWGDNLHVHMLCWTANMEMRTVAKLYLKKPSLIPQLFLHRPVPCVAFHLALLSVEIFLQTSCQLFLGHFLFHYCCVGHFFSFHPANFHVYFFVFLVFLQLSPVVALHHHCTNFRRQLL